MPIVGVALKATTILFYSFLCRARFVWTPWGKYACDGNDIVRAVFVCVSVTASQASEASDASGVVADGEEEESEDDPDFGDVAEDDGDDAEDEDEVDESAQDAEEDSPVAITKRQRLQARVPARKSASRPSLPRSGPSPKARLRAKRASATKPSPTRLRRKTSPQSASRPGVFAFARGKANCQMCDRKDPSWVTTCTSMDRHR
jgi:hypothetical protein